MEAARVVPVLHTAFAFAFRPPALFFDTPTYLLSPAL